MRHSKAPAPEERLSKDRLNSWKEIAGHLGVSVRTAQRWEALEKLPVRRHRHAVLGTVYAFGRELEEWLERRTLESGEAARGQGCGHVAANVGAAATSIAVLPFVNLDRDQESEVMADGLTEDLITSLSQIQNVKVVARTSVFHFKGKAVDVRQVAKDLGVETIVEGSVRRARNRWRVVAQLINARDGCHLWAQRFDRAMSDLFELQDDLCRAITGSLRLRLAPRATVLSRRIDDDKAYHLFLTGRHFWNQRTHDGLEKAVDYYRQAIAREPDFALAHAGLADCHVFLWVYGGCPWARALKDGAAAAIEALRLDPKLAEAHTSMGLISIARYEFRSALQSFERALQLHPHDVRASHWSAMVKAQLGRYDEAVDQISRATERDRFGMTLNQDFGRVLYLARRYDEAAAQLKHTLEIAPAAPWGRLYLGMACVLQGNLNEALTVFGEDPILRAFVHGLKGRKAEAGKALAGKLPAKANHTRRSLLHFCRGEEEKAIECLRRGGEAHEPDYLELCVKVQPLFDPLRRFPEFRALPPVD